MIQVVRFREELAPAVRQFNRRVGPALGTSFPDSPYSGWLGKAEGRRIWEERFLAVEDGQVRGAYILIRRPMMIGGQMVETAALRLPIFEGLVNRAYAEVGFQVIRDAMRRQPLLHAAGMAGEAEPLSRVLHSLQWGVRPLPFFFKVSDAGRFLREARGMSRFVGALAVCSSASKLLGSAVERGRRMPGWPQAELVDRFESWADRVWEAATPRYAAAALRDSHTLNVLYRPGADQPLRVRVWQGGRLLGWAVAVDHPLAGDRRFGNLRAGTILDCLAAPEDAAGVIWAVTRVLEERGVDFLCSSQTHPAWARALRQAGFLPGAPRLAVAWSPGLTRRLLEADPRTRGLHINQGDAAGPLGLAPKGALAQ